MYVSSSGYHSERHHLSTFYFRYFIIDGRDISVENVTKQDGNTPCALDWLTLEELNVRQDFMRVAVTNTTPTGARNCQRKMYIRAYLK
jgi:hypothetical protein